MPENGYYFWLLDRIEALHGEYSNRRKLLQCLFSIDYIYVLNGDMDRAAGGKNLRTIYSIEEGVYLEDTKHGECSVLEMLIALATRMSEFSEKPTVYWFWDMMKNLGLYDYTDEGFDECAEYAVNDIVNIWMNRLYDREGHGNIFITKCANRDMRSTPVWTQMNNYISEQIRNN